GLPAADRARRPSGLAAPRRLGDLALARAAGHERLLVGERHGHDLSFRRFGAGAMPFSTTPTIRSFATSCAQPCRPRRWTKGQATALNATSAAATTSSTAS